MVTMELSSVLSIALLAVAVGMIIAVAMALLMWDSPGGPGWHRKQYEAALHLARRQADANLLGAVLDEAAIEAHRNMLRESAMRQRQSS
jgi:hypothetical protein